MNKCKCIIGMLLSCVAIGLSAQTKASWPAMQTTFLLNVAVSDQRPPALGLTLARAGFLGYYANFMIGIDNIHLNYDYRAAADGSLTDGENAGLIPFYTGKRANNRLSATVGGICRMVIPLYTYVGAGYGYRTETRELLNRKWVESATSLGHSGIVEAGLIGRIEAITLQAGYTLFIGRDNRLYHEARVGLGVTINR